VSVQVAMAHDVFISYPTADKQTADAVVHSLEAAGIRCWIAPRDVAPGGDWAAEIVGAIGASRLMVLVFSDAANGSDHILREVRVASDAGIPIVPFRTTRSEPAPALAYYIGGTHWLDALTRPLERHLAALTATAAGLLGTQPEAGAAPAGRRRVPWYRRWWVLAAAGVLLAAAVAVPITLVLPGGVEEAASTLASSTTEAATTTGAATTTESSVTTEAGTTTTMPAVVGREWGRVPDDEAVFGGDRSQQMTAVVAGGPGVVAVGWDDSGGDWDAAVWASANGEDWVRVTQDEAVFGGAGDQAMLAVAEYNGALVAVGYDSPSGHVDAEPGTADAAVWVSPNGLTWERVAPEQDSLGGTGRQVMRGVAQHPTDGDLVAVGTDDESGGAAVWVSSGDSSAWEQVPYSPAVFGDVSIEDERQAMLGVTPGRPGLQSTLVAVGYGSVRADISGSREYGAVWSSFLSTTWRRVPHDEELFGSAGSVTMTAVAVGGPGFVAVGWDKSPPDLDAAVWWSEDGGLTWTRVPRLDLLREGEQVMRAVAETSSGLVAVGETDGDAAVWISEDGIAWSPVQDDGTVFGGFGVQSMRGVVTFGEVLLAVGYDESGGDQDAAVWIRSPSH
jgi:hypothetical protein